MSMEHKKKSMEQLHEETYTCMSNPYDSSAYVVLPEVESSKNYLFFEIRNLHF